MTVPDIDVVGQAAEVEPAVAARRLEVRALTACELEAPRIALGAPREEERLTHTHFLVVRTTAQNANSRGSTPWMHPGAAQMRFADKSIRTPPQVSIACGSFSLARWVHTLRG